ncbi:hypothetical protein QJS04_geneDACA017339 [Acorus gramineus]|uniref:SnoaL-like domain-containing protein n=1 Tax=Acorus gramineus TaxID=55184 RepID=A0AAV9B7R6_ACOGR|nr:hypothetical protein QJS04_geneDACA017339 [Acorus gramineus]
MEGGEGLVSVAGSPSSVIKQLYSSINDRNLKRLSSFIADDCFFEDTTFSKPFKGKKEVMRFLSTLTEAMGKSLMFVVEDVYEGPPLAGVVTWHLEVLQNGMNTRFQSRGDAASTTAPGMGVDWSSCKTATFSHGVPANVT